ncbi:unnamed protein product, partial [Meganyctiphanes norvegica]
MLRSKSPKGEAPGYVIRSIQVLGACVLGLLLVNINIVQQSSPEEASSTIELPDPGEEHTERLLHALPHSHQHVANNKHPPPPVWGQMDETKRSSRSKLSGTVMLMIVLDDDPTKLIKSVENILHTTSGSGFHLAICVRHKSHFPLLQDYPVQVHYLRVPELRGNSILDNIQGMWQTQTAGVCRQDEISTTINVLKTDINSSVTSVHKVTLADRIPQPGEKHWNGSFIVPFEDHPYNPMLRKALVSQEEENRQNGNKEEKKEFYSDCTDSNFLIESLGWALKSFSTAEHFILLNDDVYFSPDIVSFFSQTVDLFNMDRSVYCISASNPLATHDPAEPNRLHRMDHFIGHGSLMQRKLMEEIHRDFIIHTITPGQPPVHYQNPLKWLETWLSWWSRRRRRGCVVPALPRLCSQKTSTHVCSQNDYVKLADISRLVHYRYSQDSYYELEKAEPLGTKTADCRSPEFFPNPMNNSSYVIYIKMEEYSDDFTLHHILTCCGIDVEESAGHFEGIYRFMCRGKHFFILGIPFSRYSVSIKRGDAVILAAFDKSQFGGSVNYKRFKNTTFNFEFLYPV